jgi:2-oxoglutarate dehydrogenase E2 component (dihydrolipoamide succinyltransferase)
MATEIKVPALGESVTEATVGQWFKKPGEAVKVDEPLVELETDKVTVEVPSPVAGVLSDIMVQQGSTVGIGSVLGSIKEGAAATAQPAASPQPAPAAARQPEKAAAATPAGAGRCSRKTSPRRWPSRLLAELPPTRPPSCR